MKRKELTKTFMMISKPLWSPWFGQIYFSTFRVNQTFVPLLNGSVTQFRVDDVNERPRGLSVGGDSTVVENSPPGSVVAGLVTLDEDRGQTYNYTLLCIITGSHISFMLNLKLFANNFSV